MTTNAAAPHAVPYAIRFANAVAAGKYDRVDHHLTHDMFSEAAFGEEGEGYVLAQPPRETLNERWCWSKARIDEWLASASVAGMGLEAAPLCDLLAFGAQNPDAQRNAPIMALGSVSANGGYVYLAVMDSRRWVFLSDPTLDVMGDDIPLDEVPSIYRFLLRKIKQP